MKSVVLDTNVLIDFCQRPGILKKFCAEGLEQVLIPAIVLGEYRAGIFKTRQGEESTLILNQLLERSSVKVVPVTERTAEMYAKVFQALRTVGKPIPQNDMWIAASALEHGSDLATHDEHFNFVPMLTVIIP